MKRWTILLALTISAILSGADKPVRENIEWLDIWLPGTNDCSHPRVLLIGDSITRGYGKLVETKLKDKACVARLATSKSLGDPALDDQITLVLREQAFDVIHFNNGMHGDGYTEEQYAAALPRTLSVLKKHAPRAKLIWCTTTDVRKAKELDTMAPKTARMIRRNVLATEFARKHSIPVDDLFAIIEKHPEYHVPDGVHFNEQGNEALAAQVARSIEEVLTAR